MKQSTKNKIGAGIAGVVMFFGTIAPLAAQDNAQDSQPARAPYNPRVGDSVTATVVNKFEIGLNGTNQTIIITDVDGDGRTTDDQRMAIGTSDWFNKNPRYQLQIGDKVIYIEDQRSIVYRQVYASDMQRTR
jgi:hypothetical protein